jgi:uncharacterized membrane protein (DUF4010 family)
MQSALTLSALASALGLGLLIGVVRERSHPDPQHAVAGVRTHTIVAIAGALGAALGTIVLVAVLLTVGALAIASYLKTVERDPGLTGEVAIPVTALLGALALAQPGLAAGLSVIVAAALWAKAPLHRLARERISEQELTDALLLAGAALIVLPLLPARPIDPWGVLVPHQLWRLVVLILAVGMTGHILHRVVGARWGLPLAGFLSGFASSTAAVLGFGHHARATPTCTSAAASAALFANLGSLTLLAGVLAAASPELAAGVAMPLASGAAVLILFAVVLPLGGGGSQALPEGAQPRAFNLVHALLLAGLIALLLLATAWLHRRFGGAGALAAATVVALAEVHAAGATIGQLFHRGELPLSEARWGVVLILAASALAKSVLAFLAGGRSYGWRVAAGLLGMVLAAAAVQVFRRG